MPLGASSVTEEWGRLGPWLPHLGGCRHWRDAAPGPAVCAGGARRGRLAPALTTPPRPAPLVSQAPLQGSVRAPVCAVWVRGACQPGRSQSRLVRGWTGLSCCPRACDPPASSHGSAVAPGPPVCTPAPGSAEWAWGGAGWPPSLCPTPGPGRAEPWPAGPLAVPLPTWPPSPVLPLLLLGEGPGLESRRPLQRRLWLTSAPAWICSVHSRDGHAGVSPICRGRGSCPGVPWPCGGAACVSPGPVQFLWSRRGGGWQGAVGSAPLLGCFPWGSPRSGVRSRRSQPREGVRAAGPGEAGTHGPRAGLWWFREEGAARVHTAWGGLGVALCPVGTRPPSCAFSFGPRH